MGADNSNYGLPSVQDYNSFWRSGSGNGMNLQGPTYSGDTTQAPMRNFIQQEDSPLYGGPGWINPTGSGMLQTGGDYWGDYSVPTLSNYSSGGSVTMPNASQGAGSFMVPSGPVFPYGASYSGGTPDIPAGSWSNSSPTLPAPNIGQPPGVVWNRLSGLITNPGSINNDPIFQFLKGAGSQELARKQAQAKGRFSGRSLTEAEQYGTGLAGDYTKRLASEMLPAAQLELMRYQVPLQLQLQAYANSRVQQSGMSGARAGTGRENAARDFIQNFSGGGGGGLAGFDQRQAEWAAQNAATNAQNDREYQARLAQARGMLPQQEIYNPYQDPAIQEMYQNPFEYFEDFEE